MQISEIVQSPSTALDPMRRRRSCLSCVKAKFRCHFRSDGNGCERCHQLRQECQAPEPLSRRRFADSNRERGRRNSFAVSPLQSRNFLGGENPRSHEEARVAQSRYRSVTHTSPPLTLDTASNEGADVDSDNDVNVDSDVDNPETTPMPTPTLGVSEQIDLYSARCLDTFRSCMLPYFPFFRLAPNLTVEQTVEQLRYKRPLLLKAIICVAWPIPRAKGARAVELKQALSEATFLEPQQDNQSSGMDCIVDLLLGFMTYIAWGWDYVYNRGSLSRLMMLCVSLVGEINLDRSAPMEPHTGNLLALVARRQYTETGARLCYERQRAVLGCFVLSSIVSGYFADMDAMKWTPQLEEALVTISEIKESLTDRDLVLQVRLQLLSNKAVQLRDLLQQHPSPVQPPISAAKVFSDAETLLAQLPELRRMSGWSSQHQQQTQLAHTYYVELIILETIRASSSIVSRLDASPVPDSGPSDASNCGTEDRPSLGYSDLSYMWQSVLAISACTSGFLSLSSNFLGISILQWEQLAGCIVILSHLESLDDSRINRSHARAVVDLPILLDRIAEKLSRTATDAGEQEPSSVFTQLASGIRGFRSSIKTSLEEPNQPGPGKVSGCGGSNALTYQRGYFINSKFWMDQLFTG